MVKKKEIPVEKTTKRRGGQDEVGSSKSSKKKEIKRVLLYWTRNPMILAQIAK